MRYLISFFVIATLLIGSWPTASLQAETTDLYATVVYASSNQTYQPNNTLGAPDQIYTDFFAKDTYITLDLGESNESISDLTFYFVSQEYGASYRIEFFDENLTLLHAAADRIPLAVEELTVAYFEETAYRFIKITSVEEETWSLDAVKTTQTTAEVVEEETVEITETEDDDVEVVAETSCGENQGLLVKREDDNNAITMTDSVIYTIGCDGSFHLFPNEQIYKTWWKNFNDLAYVENSFLAEHDLGVNVTVRPGTYLVKQPSNPKVYAVEPGGILRWIPDETTALTLYGSNWNKIILDLSDELFADYTLGADLTATAYPEGVFGYLPEGRVVYLSGTSYYNLPGETIDSLRLNSAFMVPLSATIMATYTDGGDLAYDEAIAFPF